MIKPEPYITRNEYFQLPESERPTHGECERHGKFEIESDESLPLKVIMATCPECSSEYNKWSEENRLKNEQEEKAKKELERLEKLLNISGVSKRHFDKTFDNYKVENKGQDFAIKSMRYFSDKTMNGECKNMILCGSVGTGKNHLCTALIRDLIERKYPSSIRIATIKEIIRYVRASWSKESEYDEQDAINNLTSTGLLIIDEMGVQTGSDDELNIIFEIINGRYENKRPTIIVSNLEKGELVELIGARVIDRLKEDGCRVLGMAWESHRETNKGEF